MRYRSAGEFFADLQANADPSRARGLDAAYRFEIAGAGTWVVAVRDGIVSVEEGAGRADCTIATDEPTFLAVVEGEQSPIGAFMSGKIRVEGDTGLALRLRDVL